MFQEAKARNCDAISNALKFAHQQPTECVKYEGNERVDNTNEQEVQEGGINYA